VRLYVEILPRIENGWLRCQSHRCRFGVTVRSRDSCQTGRPQYVERCQTPRGGDWRMRPASRHLTSRYLRSVPKASKEHQTGKRPLRLSGRNGPGSSISFRAAST
jgi:hypothetical protein